MKEIKKLVVNGAEYTVADPDAAHINDAAEAPDTVWSSEKTARQIDARIGSGISAAEVTTADKLCPAFTESGAIVICEPVEGYPLGVVSQIQPVQEGSSDPCPDTWETVSDANDYPIDHTEYAFYLTGGTYRVTAQSDAEITGMQAYDPNDYEAETFTSDGNTIQFSMPDGFDGEVWIKAVSEAEEYEVSFTLQRLIPGNIRPITGHTQVKVWRGGKNLLNVPEACTFTRSLVVGCSIPAGIYKLSCGSVSHGGDSEPALAFSNADGRRISSVYRLSSNAEIRVVIDEHATRLDMYSNGFDYPASSGIDATVNQLMLSVDSDEYEPYRCEEFAFDLGQTVYGGSLDWKTGLLTMNWAGYTFTGKESMALYGTGVSIPSILSNITYRATGICSHDKVVDVLSKNGMVLGNNNQMVYWIGILDTLSMTTADALKAWLADQYAAGTPVHIAYELEAPITIQLTPQEISALSGVNYLYSDTGDTAVTGRADPRVVISNILERLEALEVAANV